MTQSQVRRWTGTAETQREAPLTAGRNRGARTKQLPGHGRSHNRSLILQTIYRGGPGSRADLSRMTGLTKVTVSDLIADLLADGLVHELGQSEPGRPGKPATVLDLNRDAFQIIGIDLSDDAVLRGAILDVDGEIIDRAELPLAGATGDETTRLVTELLAQLSALATSPVLGVGVGSPGIVDGRGTVLASQNLSWRDEPLRDLLEAASGLPVSVSNDANAAVIAEHSFGDAGGDLMLVTVGHGVGAGLIVGGSLVYGSRYAAGELGQVMVGTDLGPGAPYSREHVLESWLSVPRLREKIAALGPDADPTPVLREAGQRLGIALAPVIGALNLAEVVLSGPPELIGGALLDACVESIRARTMADFHDSLTVRLTAHGADIVLRGAAALVLSEQLGLS